MYKSYRTKVREIYPNACVEQFLIYFAGGKHQLFYAIVEDKHIWEYWKRKTFGNQRMYNNTSQTRAWKNAWYFIEMEIQRKLET